VGRIPPTTRIFILDDHAVVRDGVRLICEEEPDLEYAGGAADLDEALRAIDDLLPDVVLVDLHLPRGSGVDLIRELRRTRPGIRSIVLTVDRDDHLVADALEQGATAWLTKDLDPQSMVETIRKAALEESPQAPRAATPTPRPRPDPLLTPREAQVLRLIARGRSNREIATALSVAERTVGSHLSSIYRKLGVPNRMLAARYALRKGLSDAEPEHPPPGD
jgi:DNA-binding NarL/FixJ family response regulator